MSELRIAGNDFFLVTLNNLNHVPHRPGVVMMRHNLTKKSYIIHTNELNTKLDKLLRNENNVLNRSFDLFMRYCEKINNHEYQFYWMKQRASRYNLGTQAHVVMKALRRDDLLLLKSDTLNQPEVVEMPVAVTLCNTDFVYYDIKSIASQRIDAYLPDIIDSYFNTIFKSRSSIGDKRKSMLKDHLELTRNDLVVSILNRQHDNKADAFKHIVQHRKNHPGLIVLPSGILDDSLFRFIGHLPF